MSSKIELNGITMNYRTEGPDDAAVVMLSNSLLTNYGMWAVSYTHLTLPTKRIV